ncbi:MAG: hypothetical protein WC156_11280, partial [Pedobacter sp.]
FKTATKSIVGEIWKPFFLYQQKTEVPPTFYEGINNSIQKYISPVFSGAYFVFREEAQTFQAVHKKGKHD